MTKGESVLCLGCCGVSPQRGVAEKPRALERGERLLPYIDTLTNIYVLVILFLDYSLKETSEKIL